MNRRGFLRRLAAVPLLAAVPAFALAQAPEKPRSPYGPVMTYDPHVALSERILFDTDDTVLTPTSWGASVLLTERTMSRIDTAGFQHAMNCRDFRCKRCQVRRAAADRFAVENPGWDERYG